MTLGVNPGGVCADASARSREIIPAANIFGIPHCIARFAQPQIELFERRGPQYIISFWTAHSFVDCSYKDGRVFFLPAKHGEDHRQ